MEGKFYEMYMKNPSNKHGYWYEEKQSKREDKKKGRSQRTRDSENSDGISVSVKFLTLSSHI